MYSKRTCFLVSLRCFLCSCGSAEACSFLSRTSRSTPLTKRRTKGRLSSSPKKRSTRSRLPPWISRLCTHPSCRCEYDNLHLCRPSHKRSRWCDEVVNLGTVGDMMGRTLITIAILFWRRGCRHTTCATLPWWLERTRKGSILTST